MKTLVAGTALSVALLTLPDAPARADSNPYLGEMMFFAAPWCPRGWAKADGQLLPISQWEALFALFGTTYGGDGRTTMALPDLRGRTAVHHGTGPGLPPKNVGQKGGAATHTLTIAEMPSHSHATTVTLNASDQPADVGTPAGANLANFGRTSQYTNTPANTAMATDAITVTSGAAGGGQAFPIEQPFTTVTVCFALQGVFPPRN